MKGSVSIFVGLFLQASASIFFHEHSHITLIPDPARDHTTFGFSLAYQQNGTVTSLVSGAPHSDLTGKVFRCPFDDVLSNPATQCGDVDIDVNKLAPYSRDNYTDLKLNLGWSVSATPDYFFTCAPLWPTLIRSYEYFGTCFMHNDTAHRYHGLIEQFVAGGRLENHADIQHGTGWRTLVDQSNKVLLIAKVAGSGGISSINSLSPLEPVRSFFSVNSNRNTFRHDHNLGASMVAGKFFDKKTTLYAISSYNLEQSKYTIHFLRYANSKLFLVPLQTNKFGGKKTFLTISGSESHYGSMFGAAMFAVDLDGDGLSELLVGAPAHAASESAHESGALYIYMGGNQALINDIGRRCVIKAVKGGSRFGSAIAANDVDGDDVPEIFVSAPYENSGEGALYILSGFEVKKELIDKTSSVKETTLSRLRYKQRIAHSDFKTFGYSLQVIPDLDDNGCDELAVGSPGSDKIMLLRCIPGMIVNVNLDQKGDQIVREQDNNFTMSVCVEVKHLKLKSFYSKLKISNKVIGVGANIEASQLSYSVVLNGTTEEPVCRDVMVKLIGNDPHEYKFYTTAEMEETEMLNSTEFNVTWAVASPYSVLEKSADISRRCRDKDCEPNVSMTIGWSGKNESYLLGSSELVTVSILVKNQGNSSYDSCVMVEIAGPPIAQFGCSKYGNGYRCMMPKPLRRNTQYPINIVFNVTQPLSNIEQINVQARLFQYCGKGTPTVMPFALKLQLNTDDVFVKRLTHNQDISDTEIRDQNVATIDDAHEYIINNKGRVHWKNVEATIVIKNMPYIVSSRVSGPMRECDHVALPEQSTFNCTFDLPPGSAPKIVASIVILKDKIVDYFVDEKLNITSNIILYLRPTAIMKEERLITTITLHKEQSFAQNKGLMIFLSVLGALIILGIVIFIMYKMEFFKRKEKTKLDALKKEHVRRMSVKRSMSMSHDRSEDPENTHLQGIEIDLEDAEDPFDNNRGHTNMAAEQETK
ncbi:integrin alpha-PS3-like [Ostrinia furnacalis]|uniref:integrin alpha-PS3-like n=1 Tax=Ostrinia furnacalis TaxID=93504 RepID=UPI0010396D7F|nr:integrin alpha-PS3-like [Ostrinia furnacalis]